MKLEWFVYWLKYFFDFLGISKNYFFYHSELWNFLLKKKFLFKIFFEESTKKIRNFQEILGKFDFNEKKLKYQISL
jgi:hypothetical protein